MSHDTNLDATFDAVVAGWNEKVPCGWLSEEPGHKPCGRAANWYLDLHGCESDLFCGHHFWAWHRENFGRTLCEFCDTRFPSFEAAFTARRL